MQRIPCAQIVSAIAILLLLFLGTASAQSDPVQPSNTSDDVANWVREELERVKADSIFIELVVDDVTETIEMDGVRESLSAMSGPRAKLLKQSISESANCLLPPNDSYPSSKDLCRLGICSGIRVLSKLPVFPSPTPEAIEQVKIARGLIIQVLASEFAGLEASSEFVETEGWLKNLLDDRLYSDLTPLFKEPLPEADFALLSTNLQSLATTPLQSNSNWKSTKEAPNASNQVSTRLFELVEIVSIPYQALLPEGKEAELEALAENIKGIEVEQASTRVYEEAVAINKEVARKAQAEFQRMVEEGRAMAMQAGLPNDTLRTHLESDPPRQSDQLEPDESNAGWIIAINAILILIVVAAFFIRGRA